MSMRLFRDLQPIAPSFIFMAKFCCLKYTHFASATRQAPAGW